MAGEKKPTGLLILEGFLLCEEIRFENNGKILFIGGFNDSITFPTFPATLPFLSFGLKVRVLEPADNELSLEIRDPDDQSLAKASGGFRTQGAGIAWLPVTIPNVLLPRPGTYKALITLGENPTITERFEAVKVVVAPQIEQKDPKPS